MTMTFGLIGNSIAQSRAPALHQLLGQLHNLPLNYQLHDPGAATATAFQQQLTALIARGYQGTNVTLPFKQVALQYVAQPDRAAQRVGAVNTLGFGDPIRATNTDYTGFIRAYRHRRADQPAGRVLLLGAGGVGRAVAFGLTDVGAERIDIFDLDPVQATTLARALCDEGVQASAVTAEQLQDRAERADGWVNCTPIGHYTTPGCPFELAWLGAQSWVFDAVYTPIDTPLLLAAAGAQLDLVTGFDLFFYQGLDAFEFWTGIAVDEGAARVAFMDQFALQSALI